MPTQMAMMKDARRLFDSYPVVAPSSGGIKAFAAGGRSAGGNTHQSRPQTARTSSYSNKKSTTTSRVLDLASSQSVPRKEQETSAKEQRFLASDAHPADGANVQPKEGVEDDDSGWRIANRPKPNFPTFVPARPLSAKRYNAHFHFHPLQSLKTSKTVGCTTADDEQLLSSAKDPMESYRPSYHTARGTVISNEESHHNSVKKYIDTDTTPIVIANSPEEGGEGELLEVVSQDEGQEDGRIGVDGRGETNVVGTSWWSVQQASTWYTNKVAAAWKEVLRSTGGDRQMKNSVEREETSSFPDGSPEAQQYQEGKDELFSVQEVESLVSLLSDQFRHFLAYQEKAFRKEIRKLEGQIAHHQGDGLESSNKKSAQRSSTEEQQEAGKSGIKGAGILGGHSIIRLEQQFDRISMKHNAHLHQQDQGLHELNKRVHALNEKLSEVWFPIQEETILGEDGVKKRGGPLTQKIEDLCQHVDTFLLKHPIPDSGKKMQSVHSSTSGKTTSKSEQQEGLLQVARKRQSLSVTVAGGDSKGPSGFSAMRRKSSRKMTEGATISEPAVPNVLGQSEEAGIGNQNTEKEEAQAEGGQENQQRGEQRGAASLPQEEEEEKKVEREEASEVEGENEFQKGTTNTEISSTADHDEGEEEETEWSSHGGNGEEDIAATIRKVVTKKKNQGTQYDVVDGDVGAARRPHPTPGRTARGCQTDVLWTTTTVLQPRKSIRRLHSVHVSKGGNTSSTMVAQQQPEQPSSLAVRSHALGTSVGEVPSADISSFSALHEECTVTQRFQELEEEAEKKQSGDMKDDEDEVSNKEKVIVAPSAVSSQVVDLGEQSEVEEEDDETITVTEQYAQTETEDILIQYKSQLPVQRSMECQFDALKFELWCQEWYGPGSSGRNSSSLRVGGGLEKTRRRSATFSDEKGIEGADKQQGKSPLPGTTTRASSSEDTPLATTQTTQNARRTSSQSPTDAAIDKTKAAQLLASQSGRLTSHSDEHEDALSMRSYASTAMSLNRRLSQSQKGGPSSNHSGGAPTPTFSAIVKKPRVRVQVIDCECQAEMDVEGTLQPLLQREDRVYVIENACYKAFNGMKSAAANLELFTEGYKNDLICPSCDEIFTDPCLLWPCGHTFCRKCIDTKMYMKSREMYVCQDCHGPSQEGYTPNMIMKRLVGRWSFKEAGVDDPRHTTDGLKYMLQTMADSSEHAEEVAKYMLDGPPALRRLACSKAVGKKKKSPSVVAASNQTLEVPSTPVVDTETKEVVVG